jgi:hypothetical protein
MKTHFMCLGASLAFILLACSNNSGGADASSDSPVDQNTQTTCFSDVDCEAVGDHCFYAITGGCSLGGSTGVCINYSQPATCTPNVACGCDGTTISVCAPDGYVTRLSAGPGACPDDGGLPESSTTDASDASDAASE